MKSDSYKTEIGTVKLFHTRDRFYVDRHGCEDGPQVVDALVGSCVGFESFTQALQAARFFREFVRTNGDISLYSVPYGIDDFDEGDLARIQYLNQHMGDEPPK